MENTQPVIIFDTDMDTDCDDAGALAILLEYAKKDKNAPEHIAFRSADDIHTFSYTLISVARGTRGGVYPRARAYSRGTCRRRGAVAPAA